MAVVKVIELLGESEESWEDATRQVVAEATKTLHAQVSPHFEYGPGRLPCTGTWWGLAWS